MLLAALTAAAALATGQAAGACTVRTATGVAFGTYDPIGQNATLPRDAAGQLGYRCRLVRPLVSLSAGGAGTFLPRRLRQGAQALGYNLFRDAGRTEIWGDGTPGTFTVLGQRGTRTLPIYGRIFPGQPAAAGSYADTVVATVNF
ncbi:MAG: spore coat protein U domain-containing protein [Deltaproteobacteria bacterium]|nr:spore coat protein U domain-containing protein [Deltaproteobacteria bacterium]